MLQTVRLLIYFVHFGSIDQNLLHIPFVLKPITVESLLMATPDEGGGGGGGGQLVDLQDSGDLSTTDKVCSTMCPLFIGFTVDNIDIGNIYSLIPRILFTNLTIRLSYLHV